MENYGQYSKFYSEDSFWKKIKGFAAKAGVKVVYIALLLYYMLVDEAVDLKSKLTIGSIRFQSGLAVVNVVLG